MSISRVVVSVAEPEQRAHLVEVLTTFGFDVTGVDHCAELLEQAGEREPGLVVVDHAFVARAGDGAWSRLRETLPRAVVVVLPAIPAAVANGALHSGAHANGSSAHGNGSGAYANGSSVHANGSGAVSDLASVIEPLLAAATNGARRTSRRGAGPLEPFVGESRAIRRLAEQARLALHSESPVLIEGETGTGKGVLAAWLHRHGGRARHAFVDLNCAGFSRELMDTELFGHEKGAFTGAFSAKPGLLEVADGGTLFLDEIGDMDLAIQAKLLKVIEEHRYRRVGDTRERQADVRILVATHHHLLDRVREGQFREDLYYRVSVLPVRVPALRQRRGDIVPLARCILASLVREGEAPALTAEAVGALVRHRWPGNLRELRNELERALLASQGGRIECRHLGLGGCSGDEEGSEPDGRTFADFEREHIERVFQEEQLHVGRASERLGIPRSTLYQKLRSFGMRPPRARLIPLAARQGR